MTHPNDPIERALRASLEQHAREAPPADLLAERIIHAADRNSAGLRTSRRSWRTWGLPLIAAGAVGAVVAAVIGIEDVHTGPSHPQAGHSVSPPVHHTTAQPTGTPVPTPTATTVPSTQTTTEVPVRDLQQVQLLDLTFVSANDGWALASSDCIHGSGRCTALLHTTNGKDWQGVTPSPFNVPGVRQGCTNRCVEHLRFANSQVGYAFGPSAFLMTKDGGASWTLEKGGALAVETLDNNVIRVTSSSSSGCPGPCDVQVETSAIGATTWTPATLPGSRPGFGVQLSRGGSDAYLLFPINQAGGGPDVTVLDRSGDDGGTWQRGTEPCPQVGGQVNAIDVAAAPDGRVSVLCAARDQSRYFIATSTDGGAHFAAQSGGIPQSAGGLLAGDPATVLGAGGAQQLAVSTNGGRSWATAPGVSGNVTFVGFESDTVGRVVTDGNTIWTTRDAGVHWTPVTFD